MHKLLVSVCAFYSFIFLPEVKSQEVVEYFENGRIKISGKLNPSGEKDGLWVTLDSINSDTISAFNFREGKRDGYFRTFFTGTNTKSKFVKSQLHNYSDWKEEEFLIKGFYRDDLLEGHYLEYFANGQIRLEGFFSKGLKHGTFKQYHDNGELNYVKTYFMGELDGLWKQFYNTGKIREERLFNNGVLMKSTVTEWYENGNKMNSNSFLYRDGSKVNHGPSEVYFETGQLQSISIYEEGKPNGEWKGYHQNGNLKYVMQYEEFVYKSYTEYDENGVRKDED